MPLDVTISAVRSYRTLSPLPPANAGLAVYSLLHWPWVYTPQALPGTLPFGARTFLPLDTSRRRLSGGLSGGRIAAFADNYKV